MTVVNVLVKSQVTDCFGATPLHLAAGTSPTILSAQSAVAVKIIDQLLAAGASANAKDDFGCSPLLTAVRAGQDEVVATLLAHGADPGAGDAYGQTAAVIARRDNHQTILALLKQHSTGQPQERNASSAPSEPNEQAAGGR